MKNKILSILVAVTFVLGVAPSVMAEGESASETAQISQIKYTYDFEDYTVQSSQNAVVNIGESDDFALNLHRSTTTTDNTESIALDTPITQDIVELELKMLPRETNGERAEAYIQLMQGASNARLNVKVSCDNGDLNRYRVRVGSKEVISKTDLYHLPKNSEDDDGNFTDEKFNRIKFVMHRVVVDSVINNDLSTFDVYLNDELKGTYTFTEIGTGGIGYTAGKQIESIKFYQYPFDQGQPLDEEIYFDDITIKGKSVVEYTPAELEMNFEASMNYADRASLVISNGTDSMYLEQKLSLSLINAEDESDITSVAETDAVKADDNTATFSFNEEVDVTPGWYYADVQRYIGGEQKGSGKKQKIYVATAEQLEALPGDFSELPESDKEAQDLIEYYLPCFLTEEEINTLLPEEDGVPTQQALDNLSFITAYFKYSSIVYTEIADVQNDFLKAKGCLELKNAQTQSDVRTVLEKGNYLAEYREDKVFISNEEEFFTHFETKRTDRDNPLISDEKIVAALRYSMAMTSLNAAERSGIEGVVGNFNDDIFGLDLTEVTADNADTLYSALYNKSYITLEDVRVDWEEAVSDLPDESVTPPEFEEEDFPASGSGSGGGSSGLSGGGGSFSGGITSKNEDKEILTPKVEPVETPVVSEIEKSLSDIKGHWAEEAIAALHEDGIITGFEDDTFRPEGTLTRAEFITMLCRMLPDIEIENDIVFSDVKDTDWFSENVKKAVSYGIIKGTDGKFMPYDCITREQLATIIYRTLKAENAENNVSFSDMNEVSDYAKDAISYLAAEGIISGYEDNTIRPKNNTSRAEAAKLLYGLINVLEKN